MKTLVINTAFLGDVIFTLPLLENLGRAGHAVHLVTRPRFGALAAGTPGLQALWTYDKRGVDAGPAGLWALGRRLRAERFDLVLGAHPSWRTGLLAAAVGAPRRLGWGPLGYTRRVRRGPRFVEDALALGEAAGVPMPVRRPRVRARAAHPAVPPGALAFVPGARWATKRWPAPRWRALVGAARAAGHPIVAVGGADEAHWAEGWGADLEAFGLSLPATAGLLAACAAVVGGDSGLAHLARAVGTPTVMLFGPTPAAAHPPDPGRVDRWVAGLSCRPCSAHGPRRCPLGHHACLDRLAPNHVMGGLQAATDRGSCGR